MKKFKLFLMAFLFSLMGYGQTYINEDFSSFINATTPPLSSGWKNTDSLNVPPQLDSIWRFDNPNPRTFNPPISGIAAILDSDFYGSGNSQDAYLLSPNFDASLATTVILEFDHYHQQLNNIADVEVFDGLNWNVVASFGTTTTANPAHEVIDISAIAAGVANAQIRFHYAGSFAWYWIVDNVNVYQPAPDDIAALSVDSLLQGCGLDSNETVAIKFYNAGSTIVNSVPVQYYVNGGTAVAETWTGVLNPGDTGIHSFSTKANMSIPGNYTVTAYTAVRGDANPVNDTATGSAFHKPLVSTFPYIEDFESGTGGWSPGGINSSWALGTPSNSVINTAASGSNSWITNLTGPYSNGEESFVEGPCFDFTNLAAPQFKMKAWWNSEFSWDGAVLQSSIDNGLSWQQVGAFGDPNNWYTDNSVDGLSIISPNQEGWTGTTGNNGSGGWVLAEHDLTGLGGQAGVKLRIAFGSDGSVNDDGFAFDDILIQNAPAIDVGIAAIPRPNNGCGLSSADSVEILVFNPGATSINNFSVNYSINAGTPVQETFTDTIYPGDTLSYVFTTTANLSMSGTYNFKAYTSATGDSNPTNDTLTKSVTNIPILSSFPYYEDFESGNGGWIAGGTNSSWAQGTPAGATIIGASSGTQAWMTGLNAQYNTGEESYVQGPCFDFTSLAAPQIKLNVWWNSEFSWDGAALQSSIDGGTTWQNIGAFGDPNNWYNDNTVNGLSTLGNQEGWTGRNSSSNGSGGWVLAEHDLTGLAGISGVLLRVAFGSDGSVVDDGFAFDNILIQDAPALDVGVVSIDEPLSGCNLGTADSVKISISNFGSTTAMNFPVSFRFNSGTLITETFADSIQPGDTAQYVFTTSTVNVSSFNTSYLIESRTNLTGDGNPLNDSISDVVTNNTQTFPFNENFDALSSGESGSFSNGWEGSNPTAALPEWRANTGSTSSTATGPTGDNTSGSGIYIYTETSGGSAFSDAYLESPCIDLSTNTTNNLRLSYYYHMYGADLGTLVVELDSLGFWVIVDTIVGQKQIANADPFNRAIVDLSGFISLSQTKVRFSHQAYPGGFNADLSIDDVSIDDSTATGIQVQDLYQSMNLYPNPSNGEFTLSIQTKNTGPLNLSMKDVNGKLVYQDVLQVSGNYRKTFDFTDLAKGVYLMQIQTEQASRVEKIIIQ